VRDLHDEETRVTDYATGGQKGTKLTRLGAMDPVAIIALARIAGMGAEKYSQFNYLKGFDYDLAFNAMMRHALLFWTGEDNDPESGLPHMAHAAWMALALVSFVERGIGNDTRFRQQPTSVLVEPVATDDLTQAWQDWLNAPVGTPMVAQADHPHVAASGLDVCYTCGIAIPALVPLPEDFGAEADLVS
jgi:hypothetical protein